MISLPSIPATSVLSSSITFKGGAARKVFESMTGEKLPPAPLVINGRTYPLWQQFIDKKAEWIGGTLNDLDMGQSHSTTITDITLEPNGTDAA